MTQRLLLMNGDMLREQLSNPLSSVNHVARLSPDNETIVETIYLAVFTRRPSQEMLEHFSSQLEEVYGSEKIARVEDIYWTLINSSEFAWNH